MQQQNWCGARLAAAGAEKRRRKIEPASFLLSVEWAIRLSRRSARAKMVRGKLTPQGWAVLIGASAGAVVSAMFFGQNRFAIFVIAGIGAIAGAIAHSLSKNRQL
jgi:hypothetical protein